MAENAMPLKQRTPAKWQADGYVRESRMANAQYLDLRNEHKAYSEDEVWALAGALEDQRDRSLTSFLMDARDLPAWEHGGREWRHIQSRGRKPQELFGPPALGRGSHAGGSRSVPTGVGTFGDAPGASRGQGRPPQGEKERPEAAAGSLAAPSVSTGPGEVLALPMIWDFRCRGVSPKSAQSKQCRLRRLFTRSDKRRYSASI